MLRFLLSSPKTNVSSHEHVRIYDLDTLHKLHSIMCHRAIYWCMKEDWVVPWIWDVALRFSVNKKMQHAKTAAPTSPTCHCFKLPQEEAANNGGVESGKWGWICIELRAVLLYAVSHTDAQTHTHILCVQTLVTYIFFCLCICCVCVCAAASVTAWKTFTCTGNTEKELFSTKKPRKQQQKTFNVSLIWLTTRCVKRIAFTC